MDILQTLLPNLTWNTLWGSILLLLGIFLRLRTGLIKQLTGRKTLGLYISNIMILAGLVLVFLFSFVQDVVKTTIGVVALASVVVIVLVMYLLFFAGERT